ncbi:MAG: TolC family protein, partial [Deltaproteobacteria bacterium]|nr:TolC family protein [Deltaproteobacteria bacterium]
EAERSLLRRRASRISARRAVERMALGLSLYLRGEDGAPSVPDARALPRRLSLPEAIPENDFSSTTRGAELRAALQCHPRVAQKLAELESARIARDLARAQRAPRLDATFQHSRDLGAGPDSLGRSVFEAGLVFSMPLVMRSSRGRLAAAESQVNVLEEELRLIEDELLMRLANARSAERNAGEQFAVASALLDTSERLAAAERSRFEAGATSLFVVNQREQALARAALAQVGAARDLWQARAAWQATATCGDSPR